MPRNFDDFLRDAPPELIDALLGANRVTPENALLEQLYREGQEKEATQQPGLIRGERNMMYAASPFAHVGATLRSILGAQQSNQSIQQMYANLLRRSDAAKQLIAHGRAMDDAEAQQAAEAAAAGEGIRAPVENPAELAGYGRPGQEGPAPEYPAAPRKKPATGYSPFVPPPPSPGAGALMGLMGIPQLPRLTPMPWNKPGPPGGPPWE